MESALIVIGGDCADDNTSSGMGSENKVHEPKPVTVTNDNAVEWHKVKFKGNDFNFGKVGENELSNCDVVWKYFFRSEAKWKNNRYLAQCMFCESVVVGRVSGMCNHITHCLKCDSETRTKLLKNKSLKNKPASLKEEMHAMSNKRFEMNSADAGKKSGGIDSYFERSISSKVHDELHVLLAQALIWGNIGFNFINNPFFIRFLKKLRPAYSLPSEYILANRIFNSIASQTLLEVLENIQERATNGKFKSFFT